MRHLGHTFLLTTGLAVLLNGCGPKGPAKYEVSGTVTFKGKPLDEGRIEFWPQEQQGTKAVGTVSNGEYRIPRDKGFFAGKYKIYLTAVDSTPVTNPAEPAFGPGGSGKERIPAKYNTKSDIVVEVKAEGSNKFDFDIP